MATNYMRTARHFRRETEQETADALGVSVMAVSCWERGKRIPGLRNTRKLEAHFGMPIEWLLAPATENGREPVKPATASTQTPALKVPTDEQSTT